MTKTLRSVSASCAERITSRLRVVLSSQGKTTYPSMPRWPDHIPGERGSAIEPVFTSGFPVYGRAWKQPLQLPYKLSASPVPRSETVSGEARCFGERRAALHRHSSREISAALHEHSRQKVSFCHPSPNVKVNAVLDQSAGARPPLMRVSLTHFRSENSSAGD